MIANLFDRNLVRILTYVLISPGSRYRRNEIKEKTSMYNVPLDASLAKLCKLKILTEKKKIYAINFEHEQAQVVLAALKKEYLQFNLPHAVYMILVEIAEKMMKEKDIAQAILFGSYAKLIYSDKSDIDIAVVLNSQVNVLQKEKNLQQEMNKLSKRYSKKIELHVFSEKEMEKSDTLISEIKKNGKPFW